jgi:hypothetical protein
MFAVVTRVELAEGGTIEEGRKQLEAEVLPQIKQIPGFVCAYFLAPPEGREGLSVIVVESEDVARMSADRMQLPPGIKLLHTEVREVAGSA